MALKLDMLKAYDRVEWVFFKRMVIRMGFLEGWISQCCGAFLRPARGLRQWDPLSLYLFIICAEGLSSVINAAVSNGGISGFQCSRVGPIVSHILFADDSLLYSKATSDNCTTIRNLLDDYASASGQLINFEKLALCVSISVGRAEGSRLASIIGVQWVKCHERYMGLPCFTSRNKKKLFSEIKERVWDKVNGWKSKLFSVGGKEVLLKAVIHAIPTFAMSLFRLPRSLISDIHTMCGRFYWGIRRSLEKFTGALGIGCILERK
ncbi:hypothetical protein Ddye_026084 [Dipteronia dyeriana]|uniref:Reverse transcriptase domain-containing protein n=1 Tax=Dipteronia dyeriana TaxID=168575 RepID=A0AAD9TLH1_9ROSI|nr:hypothetical protein Ddye_026084 [Dipteronia dyeriana]